MFTGLYQHGFIIGFDKIMPNPQESTSEILMNYLTSFFTNKQNTLFSLCLEESAQNGMDIPTIVKKYEDYPELSMYDIQAVFIALKAVLSQHDEESRENFEN